jgi:hypothetical protein
MVQEKFDKILKRMDTTKTLLTITLFIAYINVALHIGYFIYGY